MERVRMPRFGLVGWSVVLLAGCGFDTGGVASGGATVGSSIGSQEETASDGDDGPEAGADSAPEGDGSDAPATSAATDDPTGDPTTDPTGDPTGDPTTDSATEGGSSGPIVEPTTGVIDPTTGAIEPTTTGDDDGGMPDPAYPTCSGPNVCADGAQDCYEFVNGDLAVVANICVPPCGQDSDCPIPETGTAMPYCSDFSFFCRLSCDGGLTCPNGMACYALTNGTNRCSYAL